MIETVFFKRIFFALLIVFVLILCFSNKACANLNINLVAVNPSDTETKEKPILYYLPKELASDDVVNAGGLSVDYDELKSQYYVEGSITLAPKESRTIKIEVKDVWLITSEEIDMLRNQIKDNLALLEGSEVHKAAQILADNMNQKLDFIIAQQDNYSDNIERRIEEYRAYIKILEEIRKNAFSTDYLKSEPAPPASGEVVRFIIEAKNASESKPKTIIHKHYLPKEVREDNIVEKQGFDVRFDDEKQQSYLAKTEELKPGESKRYVIEIRDIWNIPIEKVDSLKTKAEEILTEMKGTEYEQSANYINSTLQERFQSVLDSQIEKGDMTRHIGSYRVNLERIAKIQEDVDKLERMLSTIRAKKIKEYESSKMKNILQKMTALRGISALSQALFGKRITITTTWRVIWGILAFLAFFTTLHFFTWWKKSQVMGEDMAIKVGKPIQEVAAIEKPAEETK